jgi:hypothetical protein
MAERLEKLELQKAALYQKFETYFPRNETTRPRSIFLHSCTVSWSDLYIPTVSLIWNNYFPVLCERTLNCREGQGTAATKQWLAAVPCPSALSRDFT